MSQHHKSQARDRRWAALYAEGYTQKEIAERENSSVSYVCQRIAMHKKTLNTSGLTANETSTARIIMEGEVVEKVRHVRVSLEASPPECFSDAFNLIKTLAELPRVYVNNTQHQKDIGDLLEDISLVAHSFNRPLAKRKQCEN